MLWPVFCRAMRIGLGDDSLGEAEKPNLRARPVPSGQPSRRGVRVQSQPWVQLLCRLDSLAPGLSENRFQATPSRPEKGTFQKSPGFISRGPISWHKFALRASLRLQTYSCDRVLLESRWFSHASFLKPCPTTGHFGVCVSFVLFTPYGCGCSKPNKHSAGFFMLTLVGVRNWSQMPFNLF